MKNLFLLGWAILMEIFRPDVLPVGYESPRASLFETGRSLLKRIERRISAENARALHQEQPTK